MSPPPPRRKSPVPDPIDLPGQQPPQCPDGRGIAAFHMDGGWMCFACWQERQAFERRVAAKPHGAQAPLDFGRRP